MHALTPAETASALDLITLALAEDLDLRGDVTAQATIPAGLTGEAALIARAPGVLAGMPVAELVLARVDPGLRLEAPEADGTDVRAGQPLGRIVGPIRAMLAAERTVLNFLQHLSGVASLTREYVRTAAAGGPARVLDTRKTLPGWRRLEKYAVRQGGGHNHRLGLHDAILIKDNHLAALGGGSEAIAQAVRAARTFAPDLPVEIEVDRFEQFEAALALGPAFILLDNMTIEQLRECVEHRDRVKSSTLLEASGGVTLRTIGAIAATGVDRISVGALTHSAPALDIALDYGWNGA